MAFRDWFRRSSKEPKVQEPTSPAPTNCFPGQTPFRTPGRELGPLVETIVPIRDELGKVIRISRDQYQKAWDLTGGNLPPHQLLHKYLVETERYKNISEQFPLLARELLVTALHNDGIFRFAEDIIDANTKLILRWADIVKFVNPESFVRLTHAGLFVDPLAVMPDEHDPTYSLIIPGSIVPLAGVRSGWGKFHNLTKIPIGVSQEELDRLKKEEKGYLHLHLGISSLTRDVYGGRRVVDADTGWSDLSGVARVEWKEAS